MQACGSNSAAEPMRWSGAQQVVVSTLVPELTDKGLEVHLERFSLGRLPLPDELSERLLGALEDLAHQVAGTDEQEALLHPPFESVG